MRFLKRASASIAVATLALTLSAGAAHGVERCRTRVDPADGTIFLNASTVVGSLKWGATLGQEANAVANAAECINTRGRAMGVRARLKASIDISGFSARNQVILTALKQYGMLLADNGSSWFVSGTSDPRWDNGEFNQLKTPRGSDFEFVDTLSLLVDPNSGQAQ